VGAASIISLMIGKSAAGKHRSESQ